MAQNEDLQVGSVGGDGRRRRLSPEEKFTIFLEASRGDIPVGEVLRKYGVHASDLKRIRETVRSAALREFVRRQRKQESLISPEEHHRLQREKDRLEKTVVEQSVELSLLKKRVNLE